MSGFTKDHEPNDTDIRSTVSVLHSAQCTHSYLSDATDNSRYLQLTLSVLMCRVFWCLHIGIPCTFDPVLCKVSPGQWVRSVSSPAGQSGVQDDPRLKNSSEKHLMDFIVRGYDRDVRPVFNASEPVVIQLGITLTQIFDMVSGSPTPDGHMRHCNLRPPSTRCARKSRLIASSLNLTLAAMGLRADSARPQRVSGSARTDSRRAESARNPIASHVNFGDDSALSAFTRTKWTAAFTLLSDAEI